MWTLLLAITRSGTIGSLPFFVLGIGGGFSVNLAAGDTTIYCNFIFIWHLLCVPLCLLDYIVVELYGCTFGLLCTCAERSQILFDGVINVFERAACFPFREMF
ncbi:hypothetical protein VPH35_135896 [Triticum aestivum]